MTKRARLAIFAISIVDNLFLLHQQMEHNQSTIAAMNHQRAMRIKFHDHSCLFHQPGKTLPWSQRFFLIFLPERDQEQAARRRRRVSKATRRERKISGYLGLESHFHADDSCQTRQIANKKSDQWQFSKHVLISRYFFKRG